MRIILAALLLYACPAWAQSGLPLLGSTQAPSSITAPGFVQAQNCSTGSTNCNVSITATGGNSLFVAAMQYSTIASWTIGDTHNTYNTVNALTSTASCCSIQTFLATNITGGALTITCNPNTGVTETICIVFELTPGTAISVDQVQTGGNSSAQTTWTTTATSTTTQAKEMLISCGGKPGTNVTAISAGGSYTIPANGNLATLGAACEYQVVSATGTYAGNMTNTAGATYIMTIATLK